MPLSGSPGVGLGGFAAGAGPDLVESPECVVGQVDVEGALAGDELVERARADDRGGHGGLVQQPGERHVGGLFAELVAEGLVGLELGPVLLDVGLIPSRGCGDYPRRRP
jgi:hypothetical protein